MSLEGERPQKFRATEGSGAAAGREVEESSAAGRGTEHPGASGVMERVVERPNLLAALKRVESNKGGAGVDGMTTAELRGWLREHWPQLRRQLLDGSYRPQPVRRVSIPKPNGGQRELGIPTVVDRFIQQAVLQVLQPMFDPTFSEHSHGFRPGRSAHGAIREAVRYVRDGRRVVVDVDVAKFFDRVNHDVLMSRVWRRVHDPRVLRLIRRYLESGVMKEGVVVERTEGTPQGGPLSPLLANILLDEVDKELERRGHAFVRYADDLNVYVRSRRAGERVMESLRRLFSRLHLCINEDKSAVASVWTRDFLGFTIRHGVNGIRARASKKSVERLKEQVRVATRPTRGHSLASVITSLRRYLLGWRAYFCPEDLCSRRAMQSLDSWVRRRLRAYQLRSWRWGRVMYHELLRRGVDSFLATLVARHSKSYWRNSQASAMQFAFPTAFFDSSGLPRLST
jgi:RNA-directed DNA polymerase